MIYFPSSGLAFLRRHVQLSNNIARRLIQSRLQETDNVYKRDTLSRIGISIFQCIRRWTCANLEFNQSYLTARSRDVGGLLTKSLLPSLRRFFLRQLPSR